MRSTTASQEPLTRASLKSKYTDRLTGIRGQDEEQLKVAQTLASSKVNSDKPGGGLQWAGGHHARRTFNKKRDQIVDWTEVLFRN